VFTVKSFVELVRYIFTIPGVDIFYSNRLCQDVLENFFGQQRQRGGTHQNPNCVQFTKNMQAFRVINTTCATVRGNCRKGQENCSIENTPLRKRTKTSKNILNEKN